MAEVHNYLKIEKKSALIKACLMIPTPSLKIQCKKKEQPKPNQFQNTHR